MFGRDDGFGVPVVAVATDWTAGKEKRVEMGEMRDVSG